MMFYPDHEKYWKMKLSKKYSMKDGIDLISTK